MTDAPNTTALADVGHRIRSLREAQGLNLHDLALLCGISASALSLIETGKRDLRLTSLIRIAEALRVPAGQLLSDEATSSDESEIRQGEGYDLGDYQ